MKKKSKRILTLLLSICMILTSVQLPSLSLIVKAAGNVTEFTDSSDRSGWAKTSGTGTSAIEFTDGAGEAGFMTLKSDGNTIFADNNADPKQDGFVEMDITRVRNARFAIIFRYNSPTDWEGIGVDSGKWLYFTGDDEYGDLNTSQKTFTADGQKAKIRIEYQGKNVKVFVGGSEIINQEVAAFSADQAGKIGFRLWGGITTQGDDDRCTINVDNVKTSDVVPVEDYQVTFTDSQSRGSWQKVLGGGSVSFHDGAGADGYALFNADGSNTVFADPDAPQLSNGYVEMKVTNKSNKVRLAIAFRYNGVNDWQGIGFDNGNIVGFGSFEDNNDYYTQSLATYNFPKDSTKIVRVAFEGDTASLYVDGELIVTHQDSRYTEKAGSIGIRTWGENSDNPGSNQVDYIRYGETKTLQEVSLSPSSKELSYDTAASKDIEIELSNVDNVLKEITNGNTILAENTDYRISGDKVTIKKEYLASIKEAELTSLKFTFEDGYTASFTVRVVRPEQSFTYTRDFAEGLDGFEKVAGSGTLSQQENAAVMNGDGVFIDQNSSSVKNTEVEFTFNPKNNNTNYGVLLRYVSPSEYIYVGPRGQNNQHFTLWGVYTQSGKVADIDDAGYVLEGRNDAYKVKVRVVDNVVTIFVDNEEIYSGQVSGITTNAGKVGFRTNSGNGMSVYKFTQSNAAMPKTVTETGSERTIASSDMTVKMDESFPRVIDYTLKNGVSTTGQEKPVYQVEINNTYYTPEVTSEFTAGSAVYHVNVEDLDVSFDVNYEVTGNTLEMKIKNVNDDSNKIYTINFPNQSMVSMSSAKANAKLTVNNYKGQSQSNLASVSANGGYNETTLAVLSSDEIAATLSGLSYKNRHEVAYKTFDCQDHKSTGLWLNEFTYRGVDGEIEIEEPWVKAAVVGDINSDGKVDYQDGAIALRDYCRAEKLGADFVTDSWMLVAMNVGSESQYPFLRILDNSKKLYLATDGFNQNLLIKGYQSEGHDASHPDYANYNKHAGGLEDLNVLLEEAEKYNTKIGVHINQTDVYPEAPQFNSLATDLAAWEWYDSSKCIIRENDDLNKTETGLDGRLAQMLDVDTKGGMDSIYIDVFFGTRWPMYKLIDNIVGRNIILGTEDVDEMVSFSAYAHGINSFNGSATAFNQAGNLVRFVDNTQADIFTASALFRGLTDRNSNSQSGIDGWQNNADLNKALEVFYTQLLPSKYLANFPVMQYTSNTKAVLGENNEVVTEMVNGVNVIKKDGLVVADGNKIFIPWDPQEETKIYHYNQNGGNSTWNLPASWNNVTTVKLYKLSDEGKTFVEEINTSNKQVTIKADAKTGYVLYKGTETVMEETVDTMEWSTGSLIKDMGFDSHGFDYWSKADDADNIVIENNTLGNSHLYMKGNQEASVEQQITGLVPGESYSASVWATTTDGRKASIEVDNDGQILENYVTRSNVMYGYHHSDKYKTYAQRITVKFVAKAETATLKLNAAACDDKTSKVDFDDVRVMKCGITDTGTHTYFEDFENVDQGLGIFTSTETDQSHLSQRNPVNPELTPDVISGTYSLKVRAGDYMRTLPSTVRFEPNTTYTVGIDYKSPSANSFTLGIKSNKASEANDTENAVLAQEAATSGNNAKGSLVVKFTTGDYDDYYIDITKKSANEYYIDNVYVDAAKAMNRETLTELVAQAKSMEEPDYIPESYKEIQSKVTAAEAVLADKDATRQEIETAYKELEAAMDEAVAYAKEEERQILKSVNQEMKDLLVYDYVEDAKWYTLQVIIQEAEELLLDEKATVPQINEMVGRLNAAKQELTPKVDRTEIHAILAKAERVDRNTVVDGPVLGTFLSTLAETQAINKKAGVTAEEIKNAADKLTDAYVAITLKADYKLDLIESALAKTEIKEEYFQDSDIAAIKDAKTKLTVMNSESIVYVKDYFEALDQLEKALANKQDKPVLSDSREIDSTDFGLSCDNQNSLTNSGADGKEGPIALAFDKNPKTHWHTNYSPIKPLPANIEIDMKKDYTINQFSYLCRQSSTNGNIQLYDLYYLNDAEVWTILVENGSFQSNGSVEKIKFTPVTTQKVKLVVKQGTGGFGTAAEFALYEKIADKNALQNAVSAFEKLNQDLYTKESVANLKAAIDRANTMLDNEEASQEDVDGLVAELKALNKALVLLPTAADLKALTNAIADAKAIQLENYKDTKAFKKALAAAEAEAADPTTQKNVNDKTLALIQAQNALEIIPNMAALKAAVAEFEKLDKSLYTKDSVDALKGFIDEASKMIQEQTATEETIAELLTKIDTATKGLVKAATEADLKALSDAITEAEAVKLEDYKNTEAFEAALKAAKEAAENPTSQKNVQDKTQTLIQAQLSLEKMADMQALREAVAAFEKLDTDVYTEESVGALKELIDAAVQMIEGRTATQAEVDALALQIEAANAALERIPGKVSLKALVDAIAAFDSMDKALYTKDSVTKLEALISEARVLVANPDATQDEVDALAVKVKAAQDSLVAVPTKEDLKALEDAIKDAKALNLKDYKNTKAFEEALAAAEKEWKAPGTQASVQAKTKALTDAQKALKKADQGSAGTGNNGSSQKPGSSVSTGDTTPIWFLVSVLGISLLALVLILLVKKQQRQRK